MEGQNVDVSCVSPQNAVPSSRALVDLRAREPSSSAPMTVDVLDPTHLESSIDRSPTGVDVVVEEEGPSICVDLILEQELNLCLSNLYTSSSFISLVAHVLRHAGLLSSIVLGGNSLLVGSIPNDMLFVDRNITCV